MCLETCWNLSLIDRKYLNNNLITITTYCRKKIGKRNERNGLKPLIELNTISYSKNVTVIANFDPEIFFLSKDVCKDCYTNPQVVSCCGHVECLMQV